MQGAKIVNYDKSSGLTYEEFKRYHIELAISRYKESAQELRRNWGYSYDKSDVKYIHGMKSPSGEQVRTSEKSSYAQFCMQACYFLQTGQLDEYEALCLENDGNYRRLALPKEKEDYSNISTELIEPTNPEHLIFFKETVEFIDEPNMDMTASRSFLVPRTCGYFLKLVEDELFVSNRPLNDRNGGDFKIGVRSLSEAEKIRLIHRSLTIGQEVEYYIGHVQKKTKKDIANSLPIYYAYPLPDQVELDGRISSVDAVIKKISTLHYWYAQERRERCLFKNYEDHLTAIDLINRSFNRYIAHVKAAQIINYSDKIKDLSYFDPPI